MRNNYFVQWVRKSARQHCLRTAIHSTCCVVGIAWFVSLASPDARAAWIAAVTGQHARRYAVVRVLAGGRVEPPFAGNGVAGLKGNVTTPGSVAVAPSGDVYFTQNLGASPSDISCVVRKIQAGSGRVSTVAGRGFERDPAGATPAKRVWLNGCNGISVGPGGNIFFIEGVGLVAKVVPSTGAFQIVAGGGNGDGVGDHGPAVRASLYGPIGLAVNRFGDVYIADTDNNRVREIDTHGVIRTVAGTGVPGFAGDRRPATRAELNIPSGVATDKLGDLFIADTENNRIREVDTHGVIRTVVGGGTCSVERQARCRNGLPGWRLSISNPQSVAVGPAGNLFFASGRIFQLGAKNKRVWFVAGDGRLPMTVAAEKAQLRPVRADRAKFAAVNIAIDMHGTIVIADTATNTIREVVR